MMEIRTADADHLLRIQAIARLAFEPYVAKIGRCPAPMTADYAEHLRKDLVFVACEGRGLVVGFCVLLINDGAFWLETIAVHPDHGGKGIGTAMIECCERYLRPLTTQYQLYTNAKMAQNLAWYERLGFVRTAARTQDGFERVFFAKQLSTAQS